MKSLLSGFEKFLKISEKFWNFSGPGRNSFDFHEKYLPLQNFVLNSHKGTWGFNKFDYKEILEKKDFLSLGIYFQS